MNNLAKNLGLASDAVAAILTCEGSGVASVRSSRSSGNVVGAKPVVSSAWADFMTDEGFGGGKSDKDAASADAKGKEDREDESSAKRAKTKNEDADATEEAPATREYDLPILTRMRPPSDKSSNAKKYITPGVLAMTGTLDSKMVGRTKRTLKEVYDLQEPTTIAFESIFDKQKVATVVTSSTAVHSIVITTDGTAYSWGRNESGQCGFGYSSACVPLPKKIEQSGKFVGAAVGKSHSILIDENGVCYAVGTNKYGQCGVNSSNDAVLNWRKCALANATGAKIVQVRY